jgi:zinc/manganese transport system permease protein
LTPRLQPDLLTDLRELVQYPFMVHALEAATIIAVLAGVVGWFMVLRRQAFAGHTLAVMAFPGAAGAALAGVSATLGYYVSCTAAAGAIAAAGGEASEGSAAVGTVQAVGLALGFLLLSLAHGVFVDLETALFGGFLEVSAGQVWVLAGVAAACLLALAVAGRPLLFATLEREVARAAGVPVAFVEYLFLIVLALAVAATSQITGALLVFAMLVAPPAAAQALTSRPGPALLLSVLLALAVAWLGLGIAYFSPYPSGFWVSTISLGVYVIARLIAWRR